MRNILLFPLLFSLANAFGQTLLEPRDATPMGEQFFTSFDGTQIHYTTTGSGQPVLLVHGFMGSGASWKGTPLVDSLVSAGYQVIVPDTRGNGQSGHPHTPQAYANDAEARDLIGLMAYLKAKRYDILGYSRGAILAARVLVLDKHVRKGILGGMGADFTNPAWPRRIQFYEALAGKRYATPELRTVVARAKAAGADTLSLALQQQFQPSTPPVQLAKVRAPVLVISGDQDAENGRAGDLAGMLPKATLQTVPGTHGSTSRTPAFAGAVVGFLKK
ncbi:MAG: alpha/beta hydrolase [Cytophagaceae bacterium]|nr:alpha/beta hydrolase [Cytophagaceae bacterium]